MCIRDSDGSEHVVEVQSNGAFRRVSHDSDFAPYFDAPIDADRAKIGNRSSGGFVNHENVVGIVVAGFGDVNVHVVGGILEAEEKAMIAVSITACLGRVGILSHELGDRRSFYAAL